MNVTKYEEVERKIEVLTAAALRCLRRDSLDMALVWKNKADKLRVCMMNMSVEQAGQII